MNYKTTWTYGLGSAVDTTPLYLCSFDWNQCSHEITSTILISTLKIQLIKIQNIFPLKYLWKQIPNIEQSQA